MIFRCAVAVEAPRHALRLVLVDNLHFIHRAVAAVATHATVHVHRMVEIGVVWNLVDADPVDGLAGFPALAHGGELRTVGLDLSVARHAGLGSRDIRVRSDFDEAVAVTAIHAELLNVNHVGEGNRLVRLVADPRVFGSELIGEPASNGRDQRTGANDQLQRKPVCPFWKKIRH